MHQKISSICEALNTIADYAEQQAQNQQPGDPLSQHKGWHHPIWTPLELANLPRELAGRLERANIKSLDGLSEEIIDDAPSRIELLQTQQTIQQMFNGNGHQAIPAFIQSINWVAQIFDPVFGFENLKSPPVPKSTVRKLESVSNRIENLDVDTKELEIIVSNIKEAHQAAEDLPSDIAELNKAKKLVEKTNDNIGELAAEAENRSDVIREQLDIANKLLENSENAYSTSVTKGLAYAFQKRARNLSISMWVWVFGLLAALIFGLEIGSARLDTLNELIKSDNPDFKLVIIQVLLALISLGAPIWFAWLSTKQISQRFQLAEDYSYKVSMAQAYEGYRREAAKIDPALEAKLLHTALNRLDEAPLRYVDDSYHATPWQELIASQEFRDAVEQVPAFKNRFMDIVSKSIPEKFKSN